MPPPVCTGKLIANAALKLGSQNKAAALLGVNQSTVSRALARHSGDIALVKKELAGKMADICEDAIAVASSGKVGEYRSKMEAVTAGAIAADKLAKLTEQPQALVQINIGEAAEAIDQISRLRAELAAASRDADGPEQEPLTIDVPPTGDEADQSAVADQPTADQPAA